MISWFGFVFLTAQLGCLNVLVYYFAWNYFVTTLYPKRHRTYSSTFKSQTLSLKIPSQLPSDHNSIQKFIGLFFFSWVPLPLHPDAHPWALWLLPLLWGSPSSLDTQLSVESFQSNISFTYFIQNGICFPEVSNDLAKCEKEQKQKITLSIIQQFSD